MIPIQADMADFRHGHETEQSVDHSEAGPQDRYQGDQLARDHIALGFHQGRLAVGLLDRDRVCSLVSQQHRQFAHKFAEHVDVGELRP
jgi:hypothetical protein